MHKSIYGFLLIIFSLFGDAYDENRKASGEYLGHLIWECCLLNSPYDELLDVEDIARGMKEAVAKIPPKISQEEFIAFSLSVEQQNFEKVAENNLKEAEAFLKKMASEKGVVPLAEGRLYAKILVEGEGKGIEPDESGYFKLKAFRQNNVPFFDNTDTPRGISQSLKLAIPGFRDGVRGMRPGEKRILYIHPDLAYGKLEFFEPNSLVIIEVELIGVQESEQAAVARGEG